MRSASSGAVRRPSRQAAERTPAMSAPVARTAGRSSARSAPGERHLEPGGVRRRRPAPRARRASSHSNSPRPSLTAVSTRQPPTPGAPRGGDQRRGRQRPAGHALGVGVGGGDDGGAAVDGLAHRAQDGDGLVLGRRAPQPDLHVGRAGARGAQGRERGGAGQVGQVADARRSPAAPAGTASRTCAITAGAGAPSEPSAGFLTSTTSTPPARRARASCGVGDADEQLHADLHAGAAVVEAHELDAPAAGELRLHARRPSARPSSSLPTTP